MEGLTQAIFSVLLVDLCSVVGAENIPGNREAFFHRSSGGHRDHVHHSSRFPLYMMQLYRILLEGDTLRAPPSVSAAPTKSEDISGLHDSDSVLSLVAKSEYLYFATLFKHQFNWAH